MRPCLPSPERVLPWLQRMHENRVYSNFGPLTRLLETRYAEFLQVSADQVVSVANCTLGIQGAVSLSSARKWLVPDFTFAATGLSVLTAGKQLLIGDVSPLTWALDPEVAKSLPEEDGIIPVMPFGAPIDLASWHRRENVVVDAAASLGTKPNLSALPETWAVAFSLHATKVLPAGEGGLMVFGNSESARRFRSWTNFGFSGQRVSATAATNAKMSEVHAAYALTSLDGWSEEKAQWQGVHSLARAVVPEEPEPRRAAWNAGVNPYWVIDCGSEEQRTSTEMSFAAAQIATRRWWPTLLSEMEPFRGIVEQGQTQHAKNLCNVLLGLPMWRELDDRKVDRIAAALHQRSTV